jgi:hypothetical protein
VGFGALPHSKKEKYFLPKTQEPIGKKYTQEQFALSFHLPLGTLRDWEQGAKQPDTAARSYLRVIEKAPQMVIQALRE